MFSTCKIVLETYVSKGTLFDTGILRDFITWSGYNCYGDAVAWTGSDRGKRKQKDEGGTQMALSELIKYEGDNSTFIWNLLPKVTAFSPIPSLCFWNKLNRRALRDRIKKHILLSACVKCLYIV